MIEARKLDGLRQRLAADAASGEIAGAVVWVSQHDEVALHEGFGGEDPRAVFRLAALTRPIVAAAALALMEDGHLALADAVAEYLPAFGRVQVGQEEGGRLVLAPARRPMTVLDLLRHSSGLTYGMFGDSQVQRLYREAGVMDPAQTNEAMAARLAELPLQCQPGMQFEYGMSTDLLGRVLEVATGRSLDGLVRERITGPLGMPDTGFHLARGTRLAQPRIDAASPPVLFDYDPSHPPAWHSGGAGLLSTAADYARFCRMLLGGGSAGGGTRVLSRKSVALMLADQLPCGIQFGTSTAALGINAPLPSSGQGYGLGVGVRTAAGLAPVPGSVGDFFWGGALGPYFWADPQEQVVAVLMLQENDPRRRARYRALLRHAVYGALH